LEFDKIIRDLKNKVYYPIYVLTGDEEFFIDKISDFIEKNVLDDTEKEFNQTILYGLEIDAHTVESEAKRYPMMASYNVVIVKEAQSLKKIEDLAHYAQNPSPTTILVLNYKHKKIDGRKAFGKSVKSNGVYFQAKKLYDNQLAPWVEQYVKSKGYEIAPKATLLLVEFLGAELSKISNELDKLMVNLPQGSTINSKNIEENIGVSKDFNAFELNNALGEKDIVKANKIINYFGQNEKGHPLPLVLPTIYRFFSQLLLYHSVKTQNNREIAAKLGIHPFFLSQYQTAARNYPVKKIARVISSLRKADLKSKGVDANLNNHQILKEMVFEILH